MRLRFWLPLRFRSLFSGNRLDRDADEELRDHLDRLAELYVRHGLAPAEAMRQARRDFGGLDQLKEECRDMRRVRPLEDFIRDIRVGLRLLARSPIFSLVAILSLAIGIGANTAIFTLINAIVLRDLPVPEPDRLFIANMVPSDVGERFSYPAFQQARDQLAGRAELCAMSIVARMQIVPRAASQTPAAETGAVQLVSGEWFDVLRQRPQMGRLLTPDDNRTLGVHPVAVLSDAFWTQRYGRSPLALGSELTINNTAFTIVGIAAPTFFGTTAGQTPAAWIPLMMQPTVRYANNASISNADGRKPWPTQQGVRWLNVFVRLPAGAAALPVADVLTRVYQDEDRKISDSPNDAESAKAIAAEHAVLNPGSRGLSNLRENLQQPLIVLLIMVGLLLAIACANIASLLLARSTTRMREMAIRLSIGAGRGRLVRQLLAESLLLSLIGGGLGLLVAQWGSRGLLAMAGRSSVPPNVDLNVDTRVLLFTLAVSVLTGVLFGLAPAMRATRVNPGETLKTQGRAVIGETAGRHFSFGKLLLAGQIALCLLLLIVAGLFSRSLRELAHIDLGFDRDHVLIFRVDPRAAGYAPTDLAALYRRLVDRVAATPGVTSASMSLHGALSGGQRSSSLAVEGYTPRPGERMNVQEEIVTHDYFRTHGIALLKGRFFDGQDSEHTRRVSVINETMAKRYFGAKDPVGQHWTYGGSINRNAPEIIGVVRDTHHNDLRSAANNFAYTLVIQGDKADPGDASSLPYLASLEARTAGSPAAMADTIRRVLREVEPRLPVIDVTTLKERAERMTREERLIAYLTSLFSGIALLLASLGLYGSISYAVTRRTSEIGIRMALGADRGSVLWLIMRDALTLLAIGLAIGLPLALLAARGLQTMLFGIRFTDVATHGGAALVLVAVAAFAAYLPARRAARVDPMLALRAD
jgi:predicted permease